MLFTILAFYFLVFGCKLGLVDQSQYFYNLHPYTTYLAVNYMDRFISKQEIPVCSQAEYSLFIFMVGKFSLTSDWCEVNWKNKTVNLK